MFARQCQRGLVGCFQLEAVEATASLELSRERTGSAFHCVDADVALGRGSSFSQVPSHPIISLSA